jgi:hypothetical protein
VENEVLITDCFAENRLFHRVLSSLRQEGRAVAGPPAPQSGLMTDESRTKSMRFPNPAFYEPGFLF